MAGWDIVRRSPDNHLPRSEAPSWWRDAVFYEADLRWFSDSDGDGVGDIDGVRERLGYLELLGVDALWLTSVPMTGAGPSVTDPHEAAAILESFEFLAEETHDCDLRLMIDVGVDIAEIRQARSREELAGTLRFWMERGADGVRITPTASHGAPEESMPAADAVTEISDLIRSTVEEYPERVVAALAEKDRSGGWHLEFHPGLADVTFDAEKLREVISHGLAEAESLGTRPTWMTADHGRPRQVTHHGGGDTGTARARAMSLVTLALPGAVRVDSGEELALPDNPLSTRVPMPWEASTVPPLLTEQWARLTVEAQLEDPVSTLSLYREALEARRTHADGDTVEWYGAPAGCFAFRRGGSLVCAVNTSEHPVPLPPGEVLLSSGPLMQEHLPPDTAVWLV